MKHYKVKELKDIIAQMRAGTVFCGANKNGRPVVGRIWYYERLGRHYIGYEHYGASAIKPNPQELRWLLEVIFRDCTEIVPNEFRSYLKRNFLEV